MRCSRNSWNKLVMPCEGLKLTNPRSFWENLMYTLGANWCMDGCDWPTWWCGQNNNGKLLLLLCCNNTLCTMSTFFQDRVSYAQVHLVQRFFGQLSLIDFCVVPADLFQSELEVRSKWDTELSTHEHLVVCKRSFRKTSRAYINVQN